MDERITFPSFLSDGRVLPSSTTRRPDEAGVSSTSLDHGQTGTVYALEVRASLHNRARYEVGGWTDPISLRMCYLFFNVFLGLNLSFFVVCVALYRFVSLL